MSDHRALLTSGNDADAILHVGGHTFHVHRAILSERSPGLAVLFAEQGNEVTITGASITRSQMLEILAFLYSGGSSTWETRDWNSLMFASLELNLSDVTEQLIEWRSNEAAGGGGELKGDMRNKLVVGWKAAQYSSEQDEPDTADCLTFSFECEGNSLQIFDYYRPEYIDEDRWLSMSLAERSLEIGGNWAKLKRRIDRNASSFVWMNRNLTIEDAGFLWEVSYGGDTPGYAVDLDHLFTELHRVIDAGLTLGDREMDSGVQIHMAFPFMSEDDRADGVRRTLMALMVHVDDWLFLREFVRAVIDDCNNLWTSGDVAQLMHAVADSEQRLAEHVTHGSMPNPAVKHKHVGLRGRDTYKVAHRYGFELRRAGSVEQQEDLVRYLASVLTTIGHPKHPNPTLRLRPGPMRTPHQPTYRLSDMVEFILSDARFVPDTVTVAPDGTAEAATAGLDGHSTATSPVRVDFDKLDSIALHWVERLERWEHHLVNIKLLLWNGTPTGVLEQTDEAVSTRAWNKLRRRLLFVLMSDWSRFPCATDADRLNLQRIGTEQAFIRDRMLGQLLGQRARQELIQRLETLAPDHEDASGIRSRLRADDARIVELRTLITDLAVRLSYFY